MNTMTTLLPAPENITILQKTRVKQPSYFQEVYSIKATAYIQTDPNHVGKLLNSLPQLSYCAE